MIGGEACACSTCGGGAVGVRLSFDAEGTGGRGFG